MCGSYAMTELGSFALSLQRYFFVKTSYWLFFYENYIFLFTIFFGNAIFEGFRVIIPSRPFLIPTHIRCLNPSDFSRSTHVRVHSNGYFLVLSQNHLLPQGLNRLCGFQNYVVHILVVSSLAPHSLYVLETYCSTTQGKY